MSAPTFETTTDAEWAKIANTLESWGKPFTDEDEKDWRGELDGVYPAGVLHQAVRQILFAGRGPKNNPFRPSIAEVVAEARLLLFPQTAPVSWTELWTSIMAARKNRGLPRHGTTVERAVFVGETVAAELGPVAGGFATMAHSRIERAPLGDAQYGGAELARFRAEWEEYSDVTTAHLVRGGRVKAPAELLAVNDREPRAIAAAAAANEQALLSELGRRS